MFLRPIARRRTRSAAEPGVGRAACGTRTRGSACRAREPPRTPPMIGSVGAVGRSRVRGARGRSLASAVPSQRRPSVSRKPQSGRLCPPVASRVTSVADAGYFAGQLVDLATVLSRAVGGLSDGFPG